MSAPDAATRVAQQRIDIAVECRYPTITLTVEEAQALMRLLRLSAEREEKLADAIVALREALAYYATDDEGWMEIEHAHAYEQSKALVPIRSDESGAEVSPVKEP